MGSRQTTNYDNALIRSLRPQYAQVREVQDKRRVLLFDTDDNIDLIALILTKPV
jgi:hypothetical protein